MERDLDRVVRSDRFGGDRTLHCHHAMARHQIRLICFRFHFRQLTFSRPPSHSRKSYWYQNYRLIITEKTELFTLILERKPSTVARKTCQSSNVFLLKKMSQLFPTLFSSKCDVLIKSRTTTRCNIERTLLLLLFNQNFCFFSPTSSLCFLWLKRKCEE